MYTVVGTLQLPSVYLQQFWPLRASPCLTPLVMGKAGAYWLSTLTFALDPSMVTLMSWTNIFGMLNIISSFSILPLLTLSKACLNSIYRLCRCILYSYAFSCFCLIAKMWSKVERFARNPHWYSCSISSAYSANLLYRIPDNTL